MADEELEDEEDEEEEEGEEGEGAEGEESEGGRRKLLLIIGLVVLLIVGSAGAAFFTGLLDPLLGKSEETAHGNEGGGAEGQAATPQGAVAFIDLPEMLVNLNAGTRKAAFLKIRVTLELEKPEDRPTVQSLMPRVIDNFQTYLRELRIDDLKGSAGMYRLREELLTRVNAATYPAKVNAVLFKEMLVQ